VFTSLLFLAAIVVASVVIAIVADNLGRKLGKKRLSLGRMRPRHVAMLGTGLMGGVISLVTIGLVSLASQDVRRWIVEGQQAIRDVQLLRSEQVELTQTIQSLDGRISALNQEIEDKTKQAEEAARRLAAATQRLGELRSQLAAAKRQADAARIQASRLVANISALRRSVESQRSMLSASRKALESTRATAQRATRDYQRTLRDYKDLVANRDALDKALAKLEADAEILRAQIDERTKESAAISAERDELAESLKREKEAYERARGAYEEDLSRLREELLSAQAELEQVGQILALNRDASRLSPMIFRYREEILRMPIEPSRTRAEARKLVQDALGRARAIARKRGAKSDGVPAGLFDLRDSDGNLLATVEEQEERWADLLTSKSEPLVLIVRSRVNAFAGEFVSLEFAVFRNPLVFRAGQTILETRINGAASEQAILQQIEDFLQTRLRDKVKQDGLIPIQGEEESFGTLSSETVLELVRTLRTADRAVRLIVKAKADTRAGDPLQLLFDYR
jgi:septal ring factor EnvC (AmiA/AmiB activator)